MVESSSPTRIGILLCVPKLNRAAARHLLLALNHEQHAFEYEFLPFPADDHLISPLCSTASLEPAVTVANMHTFLAALNVKLRRTAEEFDLEQEPPEEYVVISGAKFTNNYYAVRSHRLSIIALGNWKRVMAPPSFLEFAQTLLIRESVAIVSPRLAGSGHLGTKGCLFDFNQSLDEVRHKVLTGLICSYCRNALAEDGQASLVSELEHVLDKRWLGKPTDPETPAGVAFNLGYNLFITKGLRATPWESLRSSLSQAGISQLVAVAGIVVGAALIVLLGLKA